jgi:hypothetical protein|tara:strand:- start:1512 stop:1706 length:195 start_codon:yes stop_codon:yes gene_type:complete
MELTLDVKTILTIGGIIALMGGFYYSTQHRLESLENSVTMVSEQLDVQTGELKQTQKQIKRLEK